MTQDSNYELNNIVFGDIIYYFLGRKYQFTMKIVNLIDNVVSVFNQYKSLQRILCNSQFQGLFSLTFAFFCSFRFETLLSNNFLDFHKLYTLFRSLHHLFKPLSTLSLNKRYDYNMLKYREVRSRRHRNVNGSTARRQAIDARKQTDSFNMLRVLHISYWSSVRSVMRDVLYVSLFFETG